MRIFPPKIDLGVSHLLLTAIVTLALSSLADNSIAQTDITLDRLKSIPGAFVKAIEPSPPYGRAYEIWLNQPIDHADPTGRTFQQRLFISHRNVDAPTVIFTDGYAVTWPRPRELATLLKANKLEVEHRYFGVSRPDSLDLTCFTAEQAASDHHRIIALLKPIYTGSWASSGKSLGGMGAFIHRSFYPDDVDATVAYVAPLMHGREDPRFLTALEADLGSEFLDRLEEIQVTLLKNRAEVLATVFPKSIADNLYLDVQRLLDYTVAVLPFQFDGTEEDKLEIPPRGVDLAQICTFFADHVGFSYYRKGSRKTQQALHYQTATQLGYFGYPRDHLAPYLSGEHPIDCSLLSYADQIPDFDASFMDQVQERLNRVGNNIIYIYGAKDLWTACSVEPSADVNAIKIVHPDGEHGVGIRDLSLENRSLVRSALGEWLGAEFDF